MECWSCLKKSIYINNSNLNKQTTGEIYMIMRVFLYDTALGRTQVVYIAEVLVMCHPGLNINIGVVTMSAFSLQRIILLLKYHIYIYIYKGTQISIKMEV